MASFIYSKSNRSAPDLLTRIFSFITRSDGSKQTTYKGWPLYTYSEILHSGQTSGDGIENIWFVAKPDYTVMLANNQLVGNDGKQYDSTYKPGNRSNAIPHR